MNIYYVYAILDPINPGLYSYDGISFEFLPFYIGYGKNNRIDQHMMCHQRIKKLHKSYKINSILNSGYSPIFIKIKENLTYGDAVKLEILLISMIGRRDLKTGPLTNQTNGGEGTNGKVLSIETKDKISKSHIGIKHTEESKLKISKSRIGMKFTETAKENMSNCKIGILNPFYGRKHKDLHFAKPVLQINKDTLETISEYKSIMNAEEFTKIKHIGEVCKGKRKTAGGFIWKFKFENHIKSEIKNKKSFKTVCILQFDLNCNFLQEFKSVKEASKKLNITRSLISRCLCGSIRTAGGFKWKYKT